MITTEFIIGDNWFDIFTLVHPIVKIEIGQKVSDRIFGVPYKWSDVY
jgi:hypothetical protein